MKCRRCRAPAVIDLRRHNAGFCRDCFLRHCREQVRRAIDDFDMIGAGERVLVAVSGGKDSLGLWHLLSRLSATRPTGCTSASASVSTPTTPAVTPATSPMSTAASCSRSTCATHTASTSPTGHARRTEHRARRAASRSATSSTTPPWRNGYDVLATGHNLDDEAAVLFGNVLRWETEYLGRQHPVASRRARIRAQGEAAHPARRARARRVLRADRHRLHRRGVPDGGRQSPPRLQGSPERDRRTFARHQGRVRRSASSNACSARFADDASEAREDLQPVRVVRRAHHRRVLRVLSHAARARPASRSRSGASRERTVRGRRPGAPRRPAPAPASRHARGRRRSSTHTRASSRHDDLIGAGRRKSRATRRAACSSPQSGRRSRSTCSRCLAARR